MGTNEREAFEIARRRRMRVNRMKRAIVLTIAIWMIGSLLAIVILSICIVKLNQKVNSLAGSAESDVSSGGIAEEAQDTALEFPVETAQESPQPVEDTEDSEAASEEESSENVNVDYTNVVRGIDTEDNMASEGDTHYVYLTFDSTPGANTTAILDVLDTYEVQATFFVTGDIDEDNYEIVRRIVEEGNTLGMRSYSNQYSTIYASTVDFEDDLKRISDLLYDITGTYSSIYRFPGGSGNEISNLDMAEFVHILNQHEISFYDWNVAAGDASADYTAEEVVNNILEGISQYKTSVVLLHDASDKSETVAALAPLIEQLQGMDAQILPIDENTTPIQYIKADSVQ